MNLPEIRGVPQCTLEHYERDCAGRHLLHQVVSWWAGRKPHEPAIISHDRDRTVDWATLDRVSSGLACELLRRGFRHGDFFATSLPMSLEHLFLEYACFKIGVIHAPLDLRLRRPEVIRCMESLKTKGYAGLVPDQCAAVKAGCAWIGHCMTQSEVAELVEKAEAAPSPEAASALAAAMSAVGENDGAQVIFTTGSTGSPKAALLSHRNITSQNLCLGAGFGFGDERILLNLPPSHVGGQSEVLMTALFWGGSVVTLEVYDPVKSLEAIQKHRVTILGQIPAMFQFEWRLADFDKYDLSSLRKVIYGGQQVSPQFLERMAKMAPLIATGLGLTETAGFCTYTPMTPNVDEITAGLGFDMPLYAMSIRAEMNEDGTAGEALSEGQVGNICFRGPQTFLGYLDDPDATAKTISSDGYLYTGDMGRRDEKGLHFSGRAKWVIKPAGYQVFPGDVESHFCALQDKVVACGAVGVEHKLLSEAIVVFVEIKPAVEVTIAELKRHARDMASYMRPFHYVLLDAGQLPLNRVGKIDYLRLSAMAREEVDRLRSSGRWDT
jgi:fatty-acyl-CoA synthase